MMKVKVILAGMAMAGLGHATLVSAPQNTSIPSWGVTSSSAFGQTVIAPSDAFLNSFTFDFGPQFSGSGAIQYQAYVYAWDSSLGTATGSALYTSPIESYTAGAGYTGVTFNTDMAVTPGNAYILFVSTSGLQSGQPASTISFGGNNGTGAYTQGGFFFQNTGNAVQFTTTTWYSESSVIADLAFSADFENPEPSTMLLLGMGLGVLGVGVFRSKRARTGA